MNIYSIASLLAFLVCLYLGCFVYLKGTKKSVNRFFALATVCMGIWCLFPFLTSIAPSDVSAVFWGRMVYIAAFFTPTTFLHFIFALTGIEQRRREKNIVRTTYLISALFLLILFHPGFIRGITRLAPHSTVVPGPFYSIYTVFFGALCLYVIYKAFKVFQKAHGYKKTQLRYLFLAFVFAFWGGVMHFGAAYIGKELFPHDFLIIAYVGIMTYAIVQYHLMDISVVITKGVVYAVLLVLSGVIYLGLMVGVDRVFSNFLGYDSYLSHLLIFLLVSLALIYFIPRIKTKTEERIQETFFKDKYKYREVLREFTKRIILIPQEEQVLTETVANIADSMKVSKVAIILMDELSGNYVIRAQRGLNQKNNEQVFSPDDKIIKWLTENKKTLLVEEMDKILSPEETEKIKAELQGLGGVIICLPLIIQERLVGVLALGEKLSRRMFSHPDVDLLENLSLQLASAIGYKRLETQMVRVNRLVSLGTLAAGMAHEIRNPLSSIQTFAQLLPEKYNDQEFREEFSKIVVSDTQRISRLIESVMALANPRPSVLMPCDVNELLNETVFLIESKIKKDGVEVARNYDGQLPLIEIDKEQIKQAFLNIFLNALDAFSKIDGRLIKVSTRLKSIPSIFPYHEGKYVQIEIEDNGVGIEEKLLDRIFEPFFTTRPQGTGLGLAIVHKIIEQHRGFIKVYSTVGKGTTFLINLPLEEKDA